VRVCGDRKQDKNKIKTRKIKQANKQSKTVGWFVGFKITKHKNKG